MQHFFLITSVLILVGCAGHSSQPVTPIPPQNPVAVAKSDPNPRMINLPVSFSGSDSYDPDGGAIQIFEWDWNNDGTYDEKGENVEHAWSGFGTFLVQLRVTDDEGQIDELDKPLSVVIASVNPVAVAKADPNPLFVNLPVSFSGSDSYDPDGGNIALYEWDWNNDGTYDATGENIDHTWISSGTYLVQLRVTDDESETDTLDTPLEIIITANPVAVAEADPNPQTVNLPINFSASDSYDPDGGDIQLYEWDWNNDGTYDATGENVDHAWTSSGDYLVQLRVTDDEAQTDTLDTPLSVEITSQNPVAVAEADPNPQSVNQPVSFSATGSYDPDGGDIVLYEWDWDYDSVTGFVPDETGEEADHVWPSSGTYFVQLRVTDDESETDLLDEPFEIGITPGFNPVDITPPWLNFCAEDVCVDGNYAYIAGYVNGLHIFDISDPANPVWVNWVDTPGEAYGVAVSGGYAYVADFWSGF
jgi:PKD repeat protein